MHEGSDYSQGVSLTWLFLQEIVAFLLITLANIPPSVLIPRDNGVTSNSSMSFTSPDIIASYHPNITIITPPHSA